MDSVSSWICFPLGDRPLTKSDSGLFASVIDSPAPVSSSSELLPSSSSLLLMQRILVSIAAEISRRSSRESASVGNDVSTARST